MQGWHDWFCSINPEVEITCACEHPGQMYLQLRGLCPESRLERFYVPRNMPWSGLPVMVGLKSSIIQYSKEALAWQLVEQTHNTTALAEAPFPSYGLGAHSWLIQGDNPTCSSKGGPHTRRLKLTGCREGDFTCSDGQCIRSGNSLHRTMSILTRKLRIHEISTFSAVEWRSDVTR